MTQVVGTRFGPLILLMLTLPPDDEDSQLESEPPLKKPKLSKGKPPAKAPVVAITAQTKKAFAERKVAHLDWLLTFGIDYIMPRLRNKCYKHDSVKVLSASDIAHGSSLEAREAGGNEEFLACGCRIEGLILDHLAFKVGFM
jgi:hypothetical protein